MTQAELEKTVDVKEFYPSDLFEYASDLTTGELTVLKQLREALLEKVYPVINEHWEKAKFPFEAFDAVAKVRPLDNPLLFEGREGKRKPSELYNVFLYFELAKVDASIATYFTVHGGLFYNTLLQGGSEEQVERWAAKTASFESIGCFGLTEPDHGSDIAGGLATSARKEGDEWVLNGEKRWIGGGTTADEIVIFARSEEDKQVKAFLVPQGAEGYHAENIPNKVSLRAIGNAHITLTDVRVGEDRRLQKVNSFKDVANILRTTRADIAHLANGLAAGAFEASLRYVKNREQFGRQIGSFQIIQERLALMQANVMANLSYSVRLAQLQEKGNYQEVNSSLAKMHNAYRMRETVAWAREIVGGNGITLETDVARFFADAEAIYSYEGTHEINALIVGRKLTGKGAFL